MATIKSINPYNGNTIKSYTAHAEKEITNALEKAEECFQVWKNVSFEKKNI